MDFSLLDVVFPAKIAVPPEDLPVLVESLGGMAIPAFWKPEQKNSISGAGWWAVAKGRSSRPGSGHDPVNGATWRAHDRWSRARFLPRHRHIAILTKKPDPAWGRPRAVGRGGFVSDIFNEVDEEVRREQLKKLWERYGNLIVAAAFLVVAGVAAWRGYEYWQARKAAEAGAVYESALKLSDEGKHSDAEEALGKLATQGTSGYRQLAKLRQAAELGATDPKAGVAAYDAIAGESGPSLIRELASVRAAMLLLDTAKLDEMTQRLEPLTQPTSSFRHSARELLALSAWRNGDAGAARKWAEAAGSDPEVPPGIRARAEVLNTLLADTSKT
jgi:hypothetical protein